MAKNVVKDLHDTRHVRCRDCEHARLHQYGNDPLLAFCLMKPVVMGCKPYQVEVAGMLHSCKMFSLHEECGTRSVERLEKTWA